jgi:hypothetical protein
VGDVTCEFCGTVTRIKPERLRQPELTTIIVSPNPIAEITARSREAARTRNTGAGRWLGCLIWLILLSGLAYYFGLERLTSVAQDIRTIIEQQIGAQSAPTSRTTTNVVATPSVVAVATISRARPTSSLPAVPNPTSEATPTDAPAPTNTPRPAPPTRTPPPIAPPTTNNSCTDPHNMFLSPLDGLTLRGRVNMNSDVSLSGYEYYKFEVRPAGAGDDAWRMIYRQDNPINVRMTWDTTTIAAGRYQLRFVTVDRTGNFPAPCVITVNVAR